MDIDLVNQTVAMMNPQEQVVTEQIAQPLVREAAKPPESKIGSMFWAKDYNADEKIPLEERVFLYNQAQSIEPNESVLNASKFAVDSGAFDYEMKDFDLSKEGLFNGLVNISKIETAGGNLPKENQVSKTGAQGLFQVVESSARDVLKNGQFGNKAAKALGISLSDIKGMTRKELQSFLLNDDKANSLFATAIIMQKLQNNRNKQAKSSSSAE